MAGAGLWGAVFTLVPRPADSQIVYPHLLITFPILIDLIFQRWGSNLGPQALAA